MAGPGAVGPIRLEPGISLFICRLLDGSGGVEGSNLVEPRISLFIYRSAQTPFGLSTGRTFESMIPLFIYSSTWARREAASEMVIVCAGSSADLWDRVGDSPCLRNTKDFLKKLKPGRPDWLPASWISLLIYPRPSPEKHGSTQLQRMTNFLLYLRIP